MIKALADAKVRTQEKKIGFARKRRGVKDQGIDDDETVSSAEPAKPTSARRHRQKRSANGSTGVEPQPFKSDRRTLFETAAIASAPASQKYRADPQILPRVHVERADHLPEASKRSARKPASSHSSATAGAGTTIESSALLIESSLRRCPSRGEITWLACTFAPSNFTRARKSW